MTIDFKKDHVAVFETAVPLIEECCGEPLTAEYSFSAIVSTPSKDTTDDTGHYEHVPFPVWRCPVCGNRQVAQDVDHWAQVLTVQNNPLLAAIIGR